MTGTGIRVIIDPYEWMPGYGESDVSFHTSGGDIVLEITYDESDTDTNQGIGMLKRTMTFRHAPYFIQAPFPGVDPLNPESASTVANKRLAEPDVNPIAFPEARPTELDSLVEIEGSSFVEDCKQVYGRISNGYVPAFRHFRIIFVS